MDVVSEGRNATGSGTGKRESGAGSEPGGSDKDSDNDEKVCFMCFLLLFGFKCLMFCSWFFLSIIWFLRESIDSGHN